MKSLQYYNTIELVVQLVHINQLGLIYFDPYLIIILKSLFATITPSVFRFKNKLPLTGSFAPSRGDDLGNFMVNDFEVAAETPSSGTNGHSGGANVILLSTIGILIVQGSPYAGQENDQSTTFFNCVVQYIRFISKLCGYDSIQTYTYETFS